MDCLQESGDVATQRLRLQLWHCFLAVDEHLTSSLCCQDNLIYIYSVMLRHHVPSVIVLAVCFRFCGLFC